VAQRICVFLDWEDERPRRLVFGPALGVTGGGNCGDEAGKSKARKRVMAGERIGGF
jgi:hypothetical protein